MTSSPAGDENAARLARLALLDFVEAEADTYLCQLRHATARGVATAGAIARLDQLHAAIADARVVMHARSGPSAVTSAPSLRRRADELIGQSRGHIDRIRPMITASKQRIHATRARLSDAR
jgi:hypothetical protein